METLRSALEWLTDSANYSGDQGIPYRIYEHVQMSSQAVAIAALVALPVGMYIGHKRRFEFLAISLGNLGRALPSFGILGFVCIKGVDPDTAEAARGMGMSELDVLRRLELPLATPLMVAGARTAAVQVVATATLGALVSWGGLGRFIVDGKSQGDSAQLLGGAILVALLAIATEVAFSILERLVSPRHMRRRGFWGAARSEPKTA
jgi:osmoprotectant transport system permease protein